MSRDGELSISCKRRGVVHAFVTYLDLHMSDLEVKVETTLRDHFAAQRLMQQVELLDQDFKSYHFVIVDATEEELLEIEQGMLDEHDERVANLIVYLQ